MNEQRRTGGAGREVDVRPLEEGDLAAADRVMRIAFGTFLGLPEPEKFMGDADFVRTRWRADPAAAFGAFVGDTLVGSNFVSSWGTVGFFGPLTILPEHWDKGIGSRLMEPVMACFDRWGTRHAGLFTFAQSAKHVGLYRKFGFWPRFLTAVMSKEVGAAQAQGKRLSAAESGERESLLRACREVTDSVYEGLDVSREIRAVQEQGLGETLLVHDGSELAGLAVCHVGAGAEAGTGTCYVKFGAVRPGPDAGSAFARLLGACEGFAAASGATHLVAGMNLARQEAYDRMIAHGFRTEMQGVAMQRPNEPGYNRPDRFVIDDWR